MFQNCHNFSNNVTIKKLKGIFLKGRRSTMTRKASIKLVSTSIQTTITKDELKELFHYYKEITSKTGSQIDWKYDQAAFPYEINEDQDQQNNSFYLNSKIDRYHTIQIGIEQEIITDNNGNWEKQTYIQIILPSNSTYG